MKKIIIVIFFMTLLNFHIIACDNDHEKCYEVTIINGNGSGYYAEGDDVEINCDVDISLLDDDIEWISSQVFIMPSYYVELSCKERDNY